jgi:hypothetical protein
MRIFGNVAAALGVVALMGIGGVLPASADWYGHHHRYYNYYGGYHGGGTWNGCPHGWTVQGGVCKSYRFGPWDIYGGRQSDYGY